MKKCSKCGVMKELDSFSIDRTSSNGRRSSCRMCESIRQKNRWYGNKERECKRHTEYVKRRKKHDPAFRMIRALRTRLWHALKGNTKSASTSVLIGCTHDELVLHIEAQFSEGMTWDNYGTWHIDHIRPLCSFDLTQKDELAAAAHYTNLQPLWAVDNLTKSGTWRE